MQQRISVIKRWIKYITRKRRTNGATHMKNQAKATTQKNPFGKWRQPLTQPMARVKGLLSANSAIHKKPSIKEIKEIGNDRN
jgi:hypothetical protein|mmetsp:Transcript_54269/g.86276  ORF Transcript_54269/g.86276 Transcript_54269/m.86276 type:complete len:82 (-) Transcript_54269:351-596(-)